MSQTEPTEQEEIDVIRLGAKLGALTKGVPDAIVLTALLALYAAIARNNCPTYGAVNALLAVAEDIAGTQAAGMDLDVQSLRTETFLVH